MGIENKIDLVLAPASETLSKLIKDEKLGTFDFAFIEYYSFLLKISADKENYDDYYEKCLLLVRKGGIIAIDNALWFGKVYDKNDNEESTKHIRNLNEKISKDKRVDLTLIPIADGLMLCRVL